MPYVKQEDRNRLWKDLTPKTPGELNYVLKMFTLRYLAMKEKLDYSALNEVVGVFESMKLEFYRRIVAGYEDSKIIENGDVYFPKQKEVTNE